MDSSLLYISGSSRPGFGFKLGSVSSPSSRPPVTGSLGQSISNYFQSEGATSSGVPNRYSQGFDMQREFHDVSPELPESVSNSGSSFVDSPDEASESSAELAEGSAVEDSLGSSALVPAIGAVSVALGDVATSNASLKAQETGNTGDLVAAQNVGLSSRYETVGTVVGSAVGSLLDTFLGPIGTIAGAGIGDLIGGAVAPQRSLAGTAGDISTSASIF